MSNFSLRIFFVLLATMTLHADSLMVANMLSRATASGDLKTLETLLSAGADPNQAIGSYETPLDVALTGNQPEAARLLLQWRADPNFRRSSGVSVLHRAAGLGNERFASILLSNGAQINASGPDGRTALFLAAGHLEMMHLLIEKGADVNARDREGAGPLDWAAWTGSLDAVAILLAHGANLNAPNTQTGATALNEAAYRGHTEIVRYLLAFHPDLAVPDRRGFTALDNSARQGNQDSAVLLLDAESTGRRTPEFLGKLMDVAIRKDEGILAAALLRSGFTGATALEDAALHGSEAVASVLLNYEAPPSPAALYAAAAFGRANIVKLFLERGANPARCGSTHKTPYQAALDNGFTEIAQLLQVNKTCAQ
jgi:ankyrin repeat protein